MFFSQSRNPNSYCSFASLIAIDFNEIFSSIVQITTGQVVLTMCSIFDLHLEQLDVKTVFLHRDLEEQIYMFQLEGFKEKG